MYFKFQRTFSEKSSNKNTVFEQEINASLIRKFMKFRIYSFIENSVGK